MKKISLYVLTAAAAFSLFSCKKDDAQSVLTPAVIASSISFDLPDEVLRLIYTDATGASVLPMLTGESLVLDYTIEPDSVSFTDVVWTSSYEDVASVTQGGRVTALSAEGTGYSMVQVSPKAMYSGSGLAASLKVVVSEIVTKAESITITSSADEVYAGDQISFSVDILPLDATYKTVEWSVSNTDAASIDVTGVLTAKQVSKNSVVVTVTATALDGSGVVATKDIIVRQVVQPQDIDIDEGWSYNDGYACAINEKSVTLTYSTEPADCTTSLLEWESSDPTIATVENGVVTFNQDGTFGFFTIKATCPATGNSSEITMYLAPGLIRETFHNQSSYSWYNANQSGNGTSSSHEWHDGYITITTYTVNSTTQRADIRCWDAATWFHVGNYPIFAFKLDDVKDQGISSRNINVDAVGTSESGETYKAIANGNNKYLYNLKCSDGSHVFVYDLSQQACGTGGLMPTTETVKFTTLQIKYADMKTATSPLSYNLYWVQTFKTLDDVKAYITDVDGLSYEE